MTAFKPASPSPVLGACRPFSPKRLFLTGANGYVGRNLVRHYIASGVQVVALVRNPAAAERVSRLGAMPIIGDVLSSALLDGMKTCDALVHAAANTDHGLGSSEQAQTNQEGTRRVFEAARQAGVQRAVHISSESVLADGRPIINADETRPLPRRPAGAYSRSKAAAETVALSFGAPSLEVVVVRPRFVWGRDDTTALPNLVQAAQSGQLAWINGGTYLTSTTHIANLCHGIELALARGRTGEVYFITDGPPVPFRDFISRLLLSQGIEPPQKSMPRSLLRSIAVVGDLLGHWSRGRIAVPLTMQAFATSAVEITLDISKATRDLGYTPVLSREQGLDEMRRSVFANIEVVVENKSA